MAALREQNIAATRPLISYHLTMPGAVFDFDIALPVAQNVAASGRVFASALPAMTVARCGIVVRWRAWARHGANCATGWPARPRGQAAHLGALPGRASRDAGCIGLANRAELAAGRRIRSMIWNRAAVAAILPVGETPAPLLAWQTELAAGR